MKKINISKQYNIIGNKYSLGQKKFYHQKEDEAFKIICDLIPKFKNKSILDAGCGNGQNILKFEKMGATKVYGLDISATMVQEAKKIVKKPNNIKLGSIEKSGFKKSSFDIIVSRFTLHYLKNFDRTYNEFNGLLKKRGILILAVAHPLRDLIIKKNKNYSVQENVMVSLYDSKVKIIFPSHTFEHFFSETFFKFFNLVSFSEQKKMKLRTGGIKVPSFFVIKAIKK